MRHGPAGPGSQPREVTLRLTCPARPGQQWEDLALAPRLVCACVFVWCGVCVCVCVCVCVRERERERERERAGNPAGVCVLECTRRRLCVRACARTHAPYAGLLTHGLTATLTGGLVGGFTGRLTGRLAWAVFPAV